MHSFVCLADKSIHQICFVLFWLKLGRRKPAGKNILVMNFVKFTDINYFWSWKGPIRSPRNNFPSQPTHMVNLFRAYNTKFSVTIFPLRSSHTSTIVYMLISILFLKISKTVLPHLKLGPHTYSNIVCIIHWKILPHIQRTIRILVSLLFE